MKHLRDRHKEGGGGGGPLGPFIASQYNNIIHLVGLYASFDK